MSDVVPMSRTSVMFRRALDALRLRGPLAADPTARMFHVLLVAIAVYMAVAALATLPLAPVTLSRLVNPVMLQASLIAALILLRLGEFQRASLVYLVGNWLWATSVVYISGGIRTHAIILYATIPISAAWLLGYGAAVWTAGLGISTMLIFACLETLGAGPPRILNSTALGVWAVAVQATLIGTIPVGQVIKRLTVTLDELQKYRQHLESLVNQRTAELVKARDEAQAANRAKSIFLANMSHELRTPLNAILGFSSLLREHGASEQQRHDLDVINSSGEHLLRLIDDVLDLAKIEAGRIQLEMAPVEVGKVTEDVMNMILPRASHKGLMVSVEPLQSPLFVRTDPARLRQVLLNLLNNAVKFTEKGSVSLRTTATPANQPGEVSLVFEVEDTGEGIKAGDHAAIFDAFVQGAAKRAEGAGLGLAISRQIVELMGGTIHVESTPGHGSRFRIEILAPRAEASEISTAPNLGNVVRLARGQPEYRILIVEDQKESWMVLERLLTYAGFQVHLAKNGAAGVEEFRKWRPQFVWMDVRMPVMDGIEATRLIRASEGGREVKIVAVTASGDVRKRCELLAEGLDDYVRKPYRPAEVFECMARHLGCRWEVSQTTSHAEAPDQPIGVLRAEDVSALPEKLREELRDAIVSLDRTRISAVIDQISQVNRGVGLILKRYADSYAYTPIFDHLNGAS
ncbi:MAG TPA: ATP-binding protein [Candidatus Sulfotelmatobacter sp.]|nr:ATP-binding protein [Candidatus Sulfotelmatobacter sp.]